MAGSDANPPAALTSATSATAAFRAAAPRADPSLEFGGERRDVGTKSGDLAQQSRRLDWIRTLAAEDGARESAYAPMGRLKLAGQTRMNIRGGEHVTDQGERGNSYNDRRAPVHTSQKNILRRVDPRDSDESNRITGQHGAVGPVAVQKSTGVDAEPEPAREGDDEQLASLREQPSDHKRRNHPDDRGEGPVRGLVVGLPPRPQGENADGDRGGGGALELQPERRVQPHHHGGPDPQGKSPGGERKAGDGHRAADALREGHDYWSFQPRSQPGEAAKRPDRRALPLKLLPRGRRAENNEPSSAISLKLAAPCFMGDQLAARRSAASSVSSR